MEIHIFILALLFVQIFLSSIHRAGIALQLVLAINSQIFKIVENVILIAVEHQSPFMVIRIHGNVLYLQIAL
jgi:hypothetical protein